MHWTVDYAKITDPELKKRKALDDVKFYLGKQYEKTCEVIRDEVKRGMTTKDIEFNLQMFLGIQGYPARVFAESFYPEQTPNTPSGTADAQASDSKVG